MTTTTPIIDPRVALLFASRGNSLTKWIEITYPEDAVPTGLLDRLAAVGFKSDGMALPAYEAFDTSDEGFKPRGYKEISDHLVLRGSGLFGSWTEAEAKDNMRRARAVLRAFGFSRVPVWKKTLADML